MNKLDFLVWSLFLILLFSSFGFAIEGDANYLTKSKNGVNYYFVLPAGFDCANYNDLFSNDNGVFVDLSDDVVCGTCGLRYVDGGELVNTCDSLWDSNIVESGRNCMKGNDYFFDNFENKNVLVTKQNCDFLSLFVDDLEWKVVDSYEDNNNNNNKIYGKCVSGSDVCSNLENPCYCSNVISMDNSNLIGPGEVCLITSKNGATEYVKYDSYDECYETVMSSNSNLMTISGSVKRLLEGEDDIESNLHFYSDLSLECIDEDNKPIVSAVTSSNGDFNLVLDNTVDSCTLKFDVPETCSLISDASDLSLVFDSNNRDLGVFKFECSPEVSFSCSDVKGCVGTGRSFGYSFCSGSFGPYVKFESCECGDSKIADKSSLFSEYSLTNSGCVVDSENNLKFNCDEKFTIPGESGLSFSYFVVDGFETCDNGESNGNYFSSSNGILMNGKSIIYNWNQKLCTKSCNLKSICETPAFSCSDNRDALCDLVDDKNSIFYDATGNLDGSYCFTNYTGNGDVCSCNSPCVDKSSNVVFSNFSHDLGSLSLGLEWNISCLVGLKSFTFDSFIATMEDTGLSKVENSDVSFKVDTSLLYTDNKGSFRFNDDFNHFDFTTIGDPAFKTVSDLNNNYICYKISSNYLVNSEYKSYEMSVIDDSNFLMFDDYVCEFVGEDRCTMSGATKYFCVDSGTKGECLDNNSISFNSCSNSESCYYSFSDGLVNAVGCKASNVCDVCNGLYGIFGISNKNCMKNTLGGVGAKSPMCFMDKQTSSVNYLRPINEVKSCYDIYSKDACELFSSSKVGLLNCTWSSYNSELGLGVCIPKDKSEVRCDYASDAKYNKITNGLLTRDICEVFGGGDCFYTDKFDYYSDELEILSSYYGDYATTDFNDKSYCLPLSAVTCSFYDNEYDCTGFDNSSYGFGVEGDVFSWSNDGKLNITSDFGLIRSRDFANKGKCKWIYDDVDVNHLGGRCIKDSDVNFTLSYVDDNYFVNGADDCDLVDGLDNKFNCLMDFEAPKVFFDDPVLELSSSNSYVVGPKFYLPATVVDNMYESVGDRSGINVYLSLSCSDQFDNNNDGSKTDLIGRSFPQYNSSFLMSYDVESSRYFYDFRKYDDYNSMFGHMYDNCTLKFYTVDASHNFGTLYSRHVKFDFKPPRVVLKPSYDVVTSGVDGKLKTDLKMDISIEGDDHYPLDSTKFETVFCSLYLNRKNLILDAVDDDMSYSDISLVLNKEINLNKDDNGNVVGSFSQYYPFLSDGLYSYFVTCYDDVGNVVGLNLTDNEICSGQQTDGVTDDCYLGISNLKPNFVSYPDKVVQNNIKDVFDVAYDFKLEVDKSITDVYPTLKTFRPGENIEASIWVKNGTECYFSNVRSGLKTLADVKSELNGSLSKKYNDKYLIGKFKKTDELSDDVNLNGYSKWIFDMTSFYDGINETVDPYWTMCNLSLIVGDNRNYVVEGNSGDVLWVPIDGVPPVISILPLSEIDYVQSTNLNYNDYSKSDALFGVGFLNYNRNLPGYNSVGNYITNNPSQHHSFYVHCDDSRDLLSYTDAVGTTRDFSFGCKDFELFINDSKSNDFSSKGLFDFDDNGNYRLDNDLLDSFADSGVSSNVQLNSFDMTFKAYDKGDNVVNYVDSSSLEVSYDIYPPKLLDASLFYGGQNSEDYKGDYIGDFGNIPLTVSSYVLELSFSEPVSLNRDSFVLSFGDVLGNPDLSGKSFKLSDVDSSIVYLVDSKSCVGVGNEFCKTYDFVLNFLPEDFLFIQGNVSVDFSYFDQTKYGLVTTGLVSTSLNTEFNSLYIQPPIIDPKQEFKWYDLGYINDVTISSMFDRFGDVVNSVGDNLESNVVQVISYHNVSNFYLSGYTVNGQKEQLNLYKDSSVSNIYDVYNQVGYNAKSKFNNNPAGLIGDEAVSNLKICYDEIQDVAEDGSYVILSKFAKDKHYRDLTKSQTDISCFKAGSFVYFNDVNFKRLDYTNYSKYYVVKSSTVLDDGRLKLEFENNLSVKDYLFDAGYYSDKKIGVYEYNKIMPSNRFEFYLSLIPGLNIYRAGFFDDNLGVTVWTKPIYLFYDQNGPDLISFDVFDNGQSTNDNYVRSGVRVVYRTNFDLMPSLNGVIAPFGACSYSAGDTDVLSDDLFKLNFNDDHIVSCIFPKPLGNEFELSFRDLSTGSFKNYTFDISSESLDFNPVIISSLGVPLEYDVTGLKELGSKFFIVQDRDVSEFDAVQVYDDSNSVIATCKFYEGDLDLEDYVFDNYKSYAKSSGFKLRGPLGLFSCRMKSDFVTRSNHYVKNAKFVFVSGDDVINTLVYDVLYVPSFDNYVSSDFMKDKINSNVDIPYEVVLNSEDDSLKVKFSAFIDNESKSKFVSLYSQKYVDESNLYHYIFRLPSEFLRNDVFNNSETTINFNVTIIDGAGHTITEYKSEVIDNIIPYIVINDISPGYLNNGINMNKKVLAYNLKGYLSDDVVSVKYFVHKNPDKFSMDNFVKGISLVDSISNNDSIDYILSTPVLNSGREFDLMANTPYLVAEFNDNLDSDFYVTLVIEDEAFNTNVETLSFRNQLSVAGALGVLIDDSNK